MRVLTPESLDDALRFLAAGPLTPIAGGTDLLVSWHQRPKDDLSLLDISRLSDLRTVRMTADALELGGLTTYWDVMSSADISAAFPLLAEAARQVGAIQIQTRGTWAGNIANASPAADGVPALMAYDATVILRSHSCAEEVPLDRFYSGYKKMARRADQLITGIRVPRRNREVEWFHKVGSRAAQAITKVGVAVVRDAAGWRVVANSVGPCVARCRNLEAALNAGRRFGSPEELEQVVAADVSPIDDIRSTAEYRRRVLARIIWFGLQDRGLAG